MSYINLKNVPEEFNFFDLDNFKSIISCYQVLFISMLFKNI